MFQAPRTPAGAGHSRSGGPHDELKRAKMELIAVRERGDPSALQKVLARYPQHAAALADFSAALTATSAYADVTPTPEVERIAAQARDAAFAAVFGTSAVAPAVAPAASLAASLATLKALRSAHQLTLRSVAGRLGLGVDVLHALEAGRIRAQSVPQRLLNALGAMLDTSAEQVAAILGGQAALNPLYLRAKTGETKDGAASAESAQLDFAQMIRLSTSMTGEQKAAWLEDELEGEGDASPR